MELTPETVQYLAKLARLEISSGEVETLRKDLEGILQFVENLPAVTGVPKAGSKEEPLVWTRGDEPGTVLEAGQAVAQAPEAEGEFFVVPRTLGKQDS